MNYLEELNSEQRKAVECTLGPVMTIAGAGSGKTRVLTYRIAHLLSQGVDPFNILALTFTNKAAREMKERISKIVGDTEARNIWMGTFHSVFARILRVESEKIGYPSNFTIYDTQDSKSLIKAILKDLQLDDKIYKPGLVQNRISSAKNNLISPTSYANNTTIVGEDRQAGKPKIVDIYRIYNERCFKSSAMDFDDLLFNMNVLLRDFPDVLNKYQHQFKYILVDEYQDTNYSQYLIVKKLAAAHENICVVGDDAQSIYSFRGANIQNILNFKKDYPDVQVFKLEQNYRSSKNIVDAANGIIARNKDQIKKEVWTDNHEGAKIKLFQAATDNEEGRLVAESIFEKKFSNHLKNKDFAVLYRTNAQSRSIEEALRKKDIAYRIYGGLSFYQRKEIKDILAYYRLVINPNDEEALKRIINYPARGIGQTSLDKVVIVANTENKSIWDIISNPNQYNTGIGGAAQNKISDFVSLIKSFIAQSKNKNAYELGNEIASTSGVLKDLYSDKTPEGISRYENIQELLNGVKEFCDSIEEDGKIKYLSDYMSEIALLTDTDSDDKDDNKVALMTIHAAKGLEFPEVFIVGMEENLFPSQLSLNSRTELEEERRLFYVALTRAEQGATLCFARSRYRWGNLIYCEPSRFIEEIDEKYLESPLSLYNRPRPSETPKDFRDFDQSGNFNQKNYSQTTSSAPIPSTPPKKNLVKVSNTSVSASANNIADIQVGCMVEHERFGVGIVKEMEGSAPNIKATINFKTAGDKQLLLKFAKLKVIS